MVTFQIIMSKFYLMKSLILSTIFAYVFMHEKQLFFKSCDFE